MRVGRRNLFTFFHDLIKPLIVFCGELSLKFINVVWVITEKCVESA